MSRRSAIVITVLGFGLSYAVCGAGAPESSSMRAEVQSYQHDAERELRGNILPFWLKNARDRERGGFHGLITQDMAVHDDAPRGSLLSSRILWTFSAAYRRFHDPQYLEMAKWARTDLADRQWDGRHGGFFWTVSRDGTPVQDVKLIYAQAFGIYALAEYHRATGDAAARDQAVALYRLVEEKAHDRKNGGYVETFARDWTRDDAPLRIMGNPAPKSQNTHIHVLEAYTNLYRVWPDAGLRDNLRGLIELMLTRIIDPQTHHLVLFFRDDWTPVSDEVSFGHDIELSWLIVEAADVLGDPALLARARAAALPMAAAALAQGIDADGGMFNEANPKGLTNPNKDWWPQAEAAVGFLNAYQLSGDAKFLEASRASWRFIEAKCVDRENGDWFESVRRDGTPIPKTKVSVWKCPYHNSRACLEVIERCGQLPHADVRVGL